MLETRVQMIIRTIELFMQVPTTKKYCLHQSFYEKLKCNANYLYEAIINYLVLHKYYITYACCEK